MRVTAEVRWFWEGTPPLPFMDWFVAQGSAWPAARANAPRRDKYLRDPGQCELGIKQRDVATLEVKGLIARQPAALGFAGCAATIELWAKWSSETLTLSNVDTISDLFYCSGNPVTHKERVPRCGDSKQ